MFDSKNTKIKTELFMPTENALFTILEEKIKHDALVLPTLPEIALKVQQKSEDPDINLNQMATVISQDPAMAARMIQVANSAILARAVKVENINQAVTRIGLRQIKNIVVAMALEQVYQSKNDIVALYMKKTWQKTIEVASYAISALYFYRKDHKHSSLQIENITLASMVHSIGVLPILTEAENHPDTFANPTFLEHAIVSLSGKIGACVLKKWNFPDELVDVVSLWSNMSYSPDNVCYIDFIRLGVVCAGIIKDEDLKIKLMASAVERGVLESEDLLLSDDFKETQASVKQMFD